VTGGIEEGDDALRGLDVIGADVLGDAAGLARCDLGAPDVIEERGLAVIDVTMTVTTGGRGATSASACAPCRSCSIWFSLSTLGV